MSIIESVSGFTAKLSVDFPLPFFRRLFWNLHLLTANKLLWGDLGDISFSFKVQSNMKNMHSSLKASQHATSLFFSNTFSPMRTCAFKCLSSARSFSSDCFWQPTNSNTWKYFGHDVGFTVYLQDALNLLVEAPKGARILSHCGKLTTNFLALVGRGIFPVPQCFWNLRIKSVSNCRTAGGWSCQIWMQSIKEGALNPSAVLFEILCGCPGRPFLVLGEVFSSLQCVGIRAKAMLGRRNFLGMWWLSRHEAGCSVFIYIVFLISLARLGPRPLKREYE